MRVKMLKDAPGSPDGITVNEYLKGDVYEVTNSLGAAFIAQGAAQSDQTKKPALDGGVDGDAAEANAEAKMDAGPSENK